MPTGSKSSDGTEKRKASLDGTATPTVSTSSDGTEEWKASMDVAATPTVTTNPKQATPTVSTNPKQQQEHDDPRLAFLANVPPPSTVRGRQRVETIAARPATGEGTGGKKKTNDKEAGGG